MSTDVLIEMIWGVDPPKKVRNQVQVQISTLRRALRVAGAADVLATDHHGYRLVIDLAASDVGVFAALESVGGTAFSERRFRAASESYRLALKLWRGPAFTDVEAAFVDVEARLLEGKHSAASHG